MLTSGKPLSIARAGRGYASAGFAKVVIVAGAAVALTLGVAGCDPLPNTEPALVALGSEDGMVMLRSCQYLHVYDLQLIWKNPSSGDEVIAWAAYGDKVIPAASTLTAALAPEDMDVTTWDTFDLEGSGSVWFMASREPGNGISVRFTPPDSGLPEGQWLKPDGSLTTDPCMASETED